MTDSGPRSHSERMLAILEVFERAPDLRLSLSEVASRVGLPLSTTHRLLLAWTTWGGLVRGDDGRFRIGLRLWRLGVLAPEPSRLRQVAFPFLEDLYEVSRENVHLAVRDGLAALYLERFAGPDSVGVISGVGVKLPLHATGVGLVLLAYAPSSVFDQVIAAGPERFLPDTMTDEKALRARMAQIRSSGMAISVNEMSPDTFSAAAPVRDSASRVVAAVSVVAHAAHVVDPQFQLSVRLAARGISRALGWRRGED
jgi:DNA-binding IclR family transcriptional regulator